MNRGTQVLVTEPQSSVEWAPLFWAASYNNDTDVVFLKVCRLRSFSWLGLTCGLKVANAGTTDLVANLFLDFPTTGLVTATSLSTPPLTPIAGQFNTSNTLDEPESIIPVASSFAIPHFDRFNYSFPAMSVTVIALQSAGIGSAGVAGARRDVPLSFVDL